MCSFLQKMELLKWQKLLMVFWVFKQRWFYKMSGAQFTVAEKISEQNAVMWTDMAAD